MFDNCQLILKNCQHPREYNSFVQEFLIDIRATVAAMEDVCPIAKHKSLKDCPVLSDHDNSKTSQLSFKTFSTLVNEMKEEDTELRNSDTKDDIGAEIKEHTEDILAMVNIISSSSVRNTIPEGNIKGIIKIERKPEGKVYTTTNERKTKVIVNLKTDTERTTLEEISSNTLNYESYPTIVTKEDNLEKDKKESSMSKVSKLFNGIKENTADKHEDVEKVYNIYYNLNNSNRDAFEALDFHDEISEEEEISQELFNPCHDNDKTCTITKLFLVLAIVSLIVLAIAFYWEFSQGLSKN